MAQPGLTNESTREGRQSPWQGFGGCQRRPETARIQTPMLVVVRSGKTADCPPLPSKTEREGNMHGGLSTTTTTTRTNVAGDESPLAGQNFRKETTGGEMRETLPCAGGPSLPRPFGVPKPDAATASRLRRTDQLSFIRDTRPIVMRALHDSRNRLDGGSDYAPIAVSHCSRCGRPDHGTGKGSWLLLFCFCERQK